MDYQKQREQAKKQMSAVYRIVEEVLKAKPVFRNLGNDDNGRPYINRLIRYIWNNCDKDYNARSIIRFYVEVMKDHPEWDTEHNKQHRANAETAYHEKFKQKPRQSHLFNVSNHYDR